jgi:hypothetical protein
MSKSPEKNAHKKTALFEEIKKKAEANTKLNMPQMFKPKKFEESKEPACKLSSV